MIEKSYYEFLIAQYFHADVVADARYPQQTKFSKRDPRYGCNNVDPSGLEQLERTVAPIMLVPKAGASLWY